MTIKSLLLLSMTLTLPTFLQAQHAHTHENSLERTPQEVGQAQFSAIAEIVQILEDDPNTNWQTVNIDALQAHLLDMDNVMTKSQVETDITGDSIIFKVTGKNQVISSIQKMSTAHSNMLNNDPNWRFEVKKTQNGADVTVFANKADLQKAQALGFYGLLTIGAHHQAHHLLIATDQNPH